MNESDILGSEGTAFNLWWDGWRGELYLYPSRSSGTSELRTGGRNRRVRFEILHDAQDDVEGRTGPGFLGTKTTHNHRIVFWVAWDSGEQRFDGYLFTVTGADAMAGVVWWEDQPYGFYATRLGRIPG